MLTRARVLRNIADFRTASALAREAGVTPRRYALFETGREYYYLKPEELQKVADVLHTTPSEIADTKGRALPYVTTKAVAH